MSTTKFAIKRKIDDKSIVESESTTKKRRIQERCNLKKEPMNESDSPVDFNSSEHVSVRKICQKLSSILHYEKKYKYFCKKHNVLYLIEKTRKVSKELTKKRRDNLVNSLRSLDLTEDFPVGKQSLLNSGQILSNTIDELSDDEENLLNHSALGSSMTKTKILRIFVTSDENELDAHQSKSNENCISKNQTTNQLILSKLIHRYILCEDTDESDCDKADTEESYESATDEDFCVTKSPGGNIVMKKVNGSSRVNDYLCCTRRNCSHEQYFKSQLNVLDSSFDSDSVDNLFTG